MTMLTWLGEDSLYLAGDAPQHITWNGIAFEKGKPVKVDDPAIIEKALKNQFFAIEESPVHAKNDPGLQRFLEPAKRGPGRPPKPKEPIGELAATDETGEETEGEWFEDKQK